jgi:hypothetical protein
LRLVFFDDFNEIVGVFLAFNIYLPYPAAGVQIAQFEHIFLSASPQNVIE